MSHENDNSALPSNVIPFPQPKPRFLIDELATSDVSSTDFLRIFDESGDVEMFVVIHHEQ